MRGPFRLARRRVLIAAIVVVVVTCQSLFGTPTSSGQHGMGPDSVLVGTAGTHQESSSVVSKGGSGSSPSLSIPVGVMPWTPTLDTLNGDWYCANWHGGNAGNVTVVSARTGLPIASIPAGMGPMQPVLDPVTGDIFVANFDSSNATVISGSTNTMTATLSLGNGPGYPVFDPANGNLYFPNFFSANLTVVNGGSLLSSGSIPAGFGASYPIYNPSTNTVDVSTTAGVAVVDPQAGRLVTTIPTGADAFPVLDVGAGLVVVSNFGSATVSLLNASTDAFVTTLSVGVYPQPAVIDSATGSILVANDGSANLSVISPSLMKVVTTVPVGTSPLAPLYAPGDSTIYVPNGRSDNLTLLSGTDYAPRGTIPVGANPLTPAYDVANGDVLVPNYYSDNLTLISSRPPALLNVTFQESGLSAGVNWTVALSGPSWSSQTTAGPTASFLAANGSYSYVVTSPSGYLSVPPAGVLTLLSRNVTIPIRFRADVGTSGPLAIVILLGSAMAGVTTGAVWLTFYRRK